MKLFKLQHWLLTGALILCSFSVQAKNILVMGDSLSAAYGLQTEQGWVALMAQRSASEGYELNIANGSISGETTSGGMARLPDLLERYEPSIVLLQLGANDGLRGTPLQLIEKNLNGLTDLIVESGALPMIVGVQLPPNYGPRYTQAFFEMYADIAEERKLPLVPFLLEGVAMDWSLMQSDGLHPTAEAQPMILDTVWAVLQPILEEQR